MKFYVAGPAAEIDMCRKLIRMVHEVGHEITFNWTHHKDDGGEGDIRNSWDVSDKAREEACAHACKERDGVQEAKILVFWLPSNPRTGKGCYWEAGIASADDDKVIWLLNRDVHKSDLVFYHLPNCHELSMRAFEAALRVCKIAEIQEEEVRRTELEKVAKVYG